MNKRNTMQRTLVLETVRALQSHATADEVYNDIVKKHPGISRGTVYRNLNLLSEVGEIRKREMPGGADRYDHLCHDHYHARCVACGKVCDVELTFMADLEEKVPDTQGFEFTGHDIVFRGYCVDCRKKHDGQSDP